MERATEHSIRRLRPNSVPTLNPLALPDLANFLSLTSGPHLRQGYGGQATDGPARQSVSRHGGIILCRSIAEALELTNAAAAEHVVAGTESIGRRVLNAGAIFIGGWTAQVAGDYAIGSNHVLPTAGAARYRGGLNAADFVKLVSVQRLTRRGLNTIATTVTTLARAEGLEGHARSIEVRTL